MLIFDEVITGFRLSIGGAQGYYGVTPDLTVLGKALGGGVTISAICGSAAVMDVVATGKLAHTGTFNVNPLVASGAVAAIRELETRSGEIYPSLEARMRELADLLEGEAAAEGLPLRVNRTVGAGYAHVCARPGRLVRRHARERCRPLPRVRRAPPGRRRQRGAPRAPLRVERAHRR